jgi:hypothetical protein
VRTQRLDGSQVPVTRAIYGWGQCEPCRAKGKVRVEPSGGQVDEANSGVVRLRLRSTIAVGPGNGRLQAP